LAISSTASFDLLLTTTLAPNSAKASATDAPIPLLAPVTTATLPDKSNSFVYFLSFKV